MRLRQTAEKLEAGAGYAADGTTYIRKGKRGSEESCWVAVNEMGEPLNPVYSDEFDWSAVAQKLPRIVLHGARHTTLSLMEKASVPISIISKWAGHYVVSFTYGQYVHAHDEDLHETTSALGNFFEAS